MYVCIVCMDVLLSLIAYPSIQLLWLQVCFNKFSSVQFSSVQLSVTVCPQFAVKILTEGFHSQPSPQISPPMGDRGPCLIQLFVTTRVSLQNGISFRSAAFGLSSFLHLSHD